MFSMAKQRVFVALFLMGFLFLGTVAAEARDTKGSDRLVKGAAVGAAVGAVTQAVRGRTGGGELLKGAAVGGAVGAAVGAYSDYKQEKDARVDAERRADYRRDNRNYRQYRGNNYGNGRAYQANHRRGNHRNCRH